MGKVHLVVASVVLLWSSVAMSADDVTTGAPAQKDRLIYFVTRARAEPTRILYAITDTPYINERIEFKDWPQRKLTTPMGFLPILVTEDGILNESNVVFRYVAKKLGLFGNSLWEEAVHDMVVENVKEISDKVIAMELWLVFKFVPVPADKESQITALKGQMIKVLNYVQSIAEKQGKKYIVGDDIGGAEAFLYAVLELCQKAVPNAMTLTSWAKTFTTNFAADPRVQKYIKERPDSPYGI